MKKKASSFYLACPLQVYLYLELIVGGETVMGGNDFRCSWENREERVWHVSTAMCCFPAYSHQTLLFPISERTTVRRNQKQ